MTLRQVLSIIWQRWILVLVTTVLVVAATAGYVALSSQVYESAATLRYSLAASRIFDGGSGYGGVDLDLDTFFVTSEEVIAVAAAATGDSPDALVEATKVKLLEGVRTNRLEITATGDTPEIAQARANGVAQAYTAHLQAQIDTFVLGLQEELVVVEEERTAAVQAAGLDPDDRLAQDRMSQALTAHLDLTNQIESLADAGPPLTLLQGAELGQPLGAKMPILVGIGLISGLVAGAGLALIWAQFDDRMRNAGAMQEVTGQPVLAEVALVPHRKDGDHLLPVAGHAPTPFNESIRSLRTALRVAYPEPHTVISLTSPMPSDGKTFLTANLAVSIARSGYSVLLISGDLRRPRLGLYFGMEADREGFAEALKSDASTEEIEKRLLPTQFDGLRLLPAGVTRSQPADLLAGDTLARVIRRTRTLADVVLIDSPPGLALADAALLGAQADGVVVVASLKTTSTRDLLATLQNLEANGAPVAGVVANRSKPKLHRRYGAYYNVVDEAAPKRLLSQQDDLDDDTAVIEKIITPRPSADRQTLSGEQPQSGRYVASSQRRHHAPNGDMAHDQREYT